MQGCPYDALYIDPKTETAAKCNFCAHKVEVGLEPPCVTVCPTQAIVAGDLDDPQSRISHLVGREPIQVRKPEKGTRPKVFYIEGDADCAGALGRAAGLRLHVGPGAAARWRCRPLVPLTEDAGAPRRTYGVKEQHRNSWGWKVSVYLWTKSLAAGVVPGAGAAVASRAVARPLRPGVALARRRVPRPRPALLLIADLRQPRRFLWTLTRPQWRSWLVRGLVRHRRLRPAPGRARARWASLRTEPPRLLTVAHRCLRRR